MMNDHGKSDRRVVPTKLPNQGDGDPLWGLDRTKPAEAVEGRRLAKSNPHQRTMFRTQRRVRMSSELERIRQVASRDRQIRFTAIRIYYPHPDKQFGVMTRGRSPVR
jgi:hypothetical protein